MKAVAFHSGEGEVHNEVVTLDEALILRTLATADLEVDVEDVIDLTDFDAGHFAIPRGFQSPDTLRSLLARRVIRSREPKRISSSPGQFMLFNEMSLGMDRVKRKYGPKDLGTYRPAIAQAYEEVCEGWAVDRVIADPDLDRLFLRSCWQRGIRLSPFLCNWVLLNMRKKGMLSRGLRRRSWQMPRDRLDCFAFATEFALAVIQSEHFRHAGLISVDRVICDPELADMLDAIAGEILPGFSSFEYRWAALLLRKAALKKPIGSVKPERAVKVKFEQEAVEGLEDGPAVYVIGDAARTWFVGETDRLRTRMESHLRASAVTSKLLSRVSHDRVFSAPAQLWIHQLPDWTWRDRAHYVARLAARRRAILNPRLIRPAA